MAIEEKEIISKMESLLEFEFDMKKTREVDLIAWANNILNLFKIVLPSNSPQIRMLEDSLEKFPFADVHRGLAQSGFFTRFKGFLKAIYTDYKEGFLINLRSEIRAEVEADFLGQAGCLLAESQKDPAAMLIGAVLEDVLRQLCIKQGIPEGPSIESMNAPLKKAGAYGLPAQQQITAWAAIRNKADHGRFNEYGIEEVKLMHMGVGSFIEKYIS